MCLRLTGNTAFGVFTVKLSSFYSPDVQFVDRLYVIQSSGHWYLHWVHTNTFYMSLVTARKFERQVFSFGDIFNFCKEMKG